MVYLLGRLGELFGEKHDIQLDTIQGIVRCMCCNNKEFKKFIHQNTQPFAIKVGDKQLEVEDLVFPIVRGQDVYITLLPSGSKSGESKIIAAIAIAATVVTGGLSGAGWAITTTGTGAAWTTVAQAALAVAANLALTGIQQLLAPDPATDSDAPESYLFNGAEQNVIEGDPVPVLYGELIVPGTPISFEIVNKTYYKNNTHPDGSGNIYLV